MGQTQPLPKPHLVTGLSVVAPDAAAEDNEAQRRACILWTPNYEDYHHNSLTWGAANGNADVIIS